MPSWLGPNGSQISFHVRTARTLFILMRRIGFVLRIAIRRRGLGPFLVLSFSGMRYSEDASENAMANTAGKPHGQRGGSQEKLCERHWQTLRIA